VIWSVSHAALNGYAFSHTAGLNVEVQSNLAVMYLLIRTLDKISLRLLGFLHASVTF